MSTFLAFVAAIVATLFAIDLGRDALRARRPHTSAYAAGVVFFAIATWALVFGLTTGWTGASYRIFFLFGAVLNIPLLAVGSMFLVIGRRAGHTSFIMTGAIAAMATTLTLTVPFVNPLPPGGIPADIFGAEIAFGPRLFAVIAGALGGTTIVVLGIVSIFRFWRKNGPIIVGNLFIVAGTLAASAGGTNLVFLDDAGTFALSLLVAVLLIWVGYRVARGARRAPLPPPPTIVLAGPSTENPERAHVDVMIAVMERSGYRVVCPARDIEDWGAVEFSPHEAARLTMAAIDEADAVVVDLLHGYGTVAAGYAAAKKIPVIIVAPEGDRIPRPLQGVATAQVHYRSADDVLAVVKELVPAPTVS